MLLIIAIYYYEDYLSLITTFSYYKADIPELPGLQIIGENNYLKFDNSNSFSTFIIYF